MAKRILYCIHGLEHDTCSICFKKPLKKIQEEVEKSAGNFNWRTPNYKGENFDADEVEYDMDYDIEVETD